MKAKTPANANYTIISFEFIPGNYNFIAALPDAFDTFISFLMVKQNFKNRLL